MKIFTIQKIKYIAPCAHAKYERTVRSLRKDFGLVSVKGVLKYAKDDDMHRAGKDVRKVVGADKTAPVEKFMLVYDVRYADGTHDASFEPKLLDSTVKQYLVNCDDGSGTTAAQDAVNGSLPAVGGTGEEGSGTTAGSDNDSLSFMDFIESCPFPTAADCS